MFATNAIVAARSFFGIVVLCALLPKPSRHLCDHVVRNYSRASKQLDTPHNYPHIVCLSLKISTRRLKHVITRLNVAGVRLTPHGAPTAGGAQREAYATGDLCTQSRLGVGKPICRLFCLLWEINRQVGQETNKDSDGPMRGTDYLLAAENTPQFRKREKKRR